jgi:molecular chaperone DnaK
MARTTIDFGIDLGTTNSEIAVLEGVEPQMVPNSVGSAITPSAVWIDKRKHLRVGQDAKQRYEADPDNCDIEFKIRMGTGEAGKKCFAASGVAMLPEELSSEVLKSLRADVRTIRGENLRAAVITVPADFELPQTNATRRAAELAGIEVSPLLQEPVAAAYAYGFQDESEKVYWLVYDFGGGTFDAAIVQVREGGIRVINHAGDNHLGGKLIDWDIVETRLVPVAVEKCTWLKDKDFRRGNAQWRAAFAKLKVAAEAAKIEVCRTKEPSEIWIEGLLEAAGGTVDFEYRLTPKDVEEVVTPYVTRSLNLCRKALEEKGLSGKDMAKVLMVGGTSLTPWLRDQVEKELQTPLDFHIDPMTVVARGAAIYAGTQRLSAEHMPPAPAGAYQVVLEYEAVGRDTDPDVAGRVRHPEGKSLKGYALEIQETKSQWRSGRIPLQSDGAFETNVLAEKGRRCEFRLALFDAAGTRRSVAPDQFTYTVGAEFDGAPLTHSLGVAMANNQVDQLIKKGTPLPVRNRRSIHKTAFAFHRGDTTSPIKIPVVEGETIARADRNRLVGSLEIPCSEIRRDLPVGSEVEITMTIDESRLMTTKAYIPVLDQHFEAVLKLEAVSASVPALREEVSQEKRRLARVREKAEKTESLKARQALVRADREEMVEQVERSLEAAQGDPAALQECEKRLRDVKVVVDQAEDALEWPTLVAEAEDRLADAQRMVNEHGEADEKSRLRTLEGNLRKAIDSGDPDLVRQQSGEIGALNIQVLQRQPGFWVGFLEYVEERRSLMRDRSEADDLIARGRRAINNNDLDGLKAAVKQLLALLPADEQQRAGGYGGTTIN